MLGKSVNPSQKSFEKEKCLRNDYKQRRVFFYMIGKSVNASQKHFIFVFMVEITIIFNNMSDLYIQQIRQRLNELRLMIKVDHNDYSITISFKIRNSGVLLNYRFPPGLQMVGMVVYADVIQQDRRR
jgi:hypothetical protein